MKIDGVEVISADGLIVNPREARLDISSLCQLDCPLCPTARNNGRAFVGRGVLSAADFSLFIDFNPQIRTIEIGNSGEVFLNPDLPAMLQYAHEKGVTIRIAEGANLNDASDDALDAIVKFGVSILRVSIDGATQRTYETYRVGGNLRKVLQNIRRINAYKEQYQRQFPRLILQFIPFGHNEDEMDKIVVLARAMKMDIFFKLNVFTGQMPVINTLHLTDLLGYSDKDAYWEKTGAVYLRELCFQLWRNPQINWDGRLLGCSVNTSKTFAENALGQHFFSAVNHERMRYARKMLMGKAPARDDIPCAFCDHFADFQKYNQWFTHEEIRAAINNKRR